MKVAILLIISFFLLNGVTPAFAQTMQNEDHFLELNPADNVDQVAPLIQTPTPQQKNKTIPLKKLNRPKPESISININSDLLSFGIIAPTSPSERMLRLLLSGSSSQQMLYISRDNNLSNGSKGIINETSCDQGTCSQFIAFDWINNLTFGYGYSCKGDSCQSDFIESKYRPLSQSLTSLHEAKFNDRKHKTLEIPIRINVPGTQEKGSYTNTITILSVSSL